MNKIFTLFIVMLFTTFACDYADRKAAEKRIYDSVLRSQDSILHAKVLHLKDSTRVAESEKRYADSIAFHNWIKNTKAGKIWKEHPEWTQEECDRLAKRQIWIGMTIEMLHYLRGLPNHVNTSNYGEGNEYQWCWDDYEPSCFYGKSDGVVTAYN